MYQIDLKYENMSGFDNQTMFANNVDFTGGSNIGLPVEPTILTNGQLIIGSTALNAGGTHINIGNLTSPLGTLTIGYSSPNITLDITGGTIAMEKIAVDASTPPGTNPVVSNAGLITITGGQVASGTVGTNIIRTDSLAANTLTVQIQRSNISNIINCAENGVAHFRFSSISSRCKYVCDYDQI